MSTIQEAVPHAEKAWEWFRSMGSPKFHVAPMVDQSELPFRRLCRKYGATCAYTPMLHARLFCDDAKYRSEVFTTCEGDRPLFTQFCANDPDYLVKAARLIQHQTDSIDINFGCPQRIAKRGYYGSFLMDNLALVEKLVKSLVEGVDIPVTCKIRVFPKVEDTIAYAKMIESAGCSLLAVHGRTREQKDNSATRADWDQIKAVKAALKIPVLANGNIRHLQDALECMAYTGTDGVLSAESLLEDPALFSPERLIPGKERTLLDGIKHCIEYLENCLTTPTHMRMVKGHVHRLTGPWLAEHTDLRSEINRGHLDIKGNLKVMEELAARVKANGRDYPIPAINPKHLERMKREEARKAAIDEQDREEAALLAIGAIDSIDAIANGAAWPLTNTTPANANQSSESKQTGAPTNGHCDANEQQANSNKASGASEGDQSASDLVVLCETGDCAPPPKEYLARLGEVNGSGVDVNGPGDSVDASEAGCATKKPRSDAYECHANGTA